MQYRKMKKTGDDLSILGYGCMRFPEKNGRIDKKRAERQIYYAIDKGVNYFDTAFPYHFGKSEPFLGEILTIPARNKIKLATKLPPYSIKVKEDMYKILNNQLQRLKTDRIDYYMLHGIMHESWNKFLKFDVFHFLDQVKKEGKIVNAGFSFHGKIETFKEIIDAYDWDFCQIQYNYLDEENQAGTEGLNYAESKGLGIIIMEPLRGGTLTGTIPDEVQKIWDEAKIKRTPAEWSFRWIMDRPEVNVVLSGMNEEKHIEENIKIACEGLSNSLNCEEHLLIKRVTSTYKKLLKIGCTACGYCLPCPAKVNIPFCFDLYNRIKSFGEQKFHNLVRYGLHLGGSKKENRSFASQCINCGKCIKKCPQHINIPENLKNVSKEFETLKLKFFTFYSKFFFSKASAK